MNEYEIIPHLGIGPIKIGMTRNEVHKVFKRPEYTSPDGTREGFFGGFMIDFNEDNIVEFIEIGRSKEFKGIFKGKCLHDLPVEEALIHVNQFGKYDLNDPELGYSYTFIELQMALWRGIIPEKDQESDNEDGRYFESVAVGEDGYFEYN